MKLAYRVRCVCIAGPRITSQPVVTKLELGDRPSRHFPNFVLAFDELSF